MILITGGSAFCGAICTPLKIKARQQKQVRFAARAMAFSNANLDNLEFLGGNYPGHFLVDAEVSLEHFAGDAA